MKALKSTALNIHSLAHRKYRRGAFEDWQYLRYIYTDNFRYRYFDVTSPYFVPNIYCRSFQRYQLPGHPCSDEHDSYRSR